MKQSAKNHFPDEMSPATQKLNQCDPNEGGFVTRMSPEVAKIGKAGPLSEGMIGPRGFGGFANNDKKNRAERDRVVF